MSDYYNAVCGMASFARERYWQPGLGFFQHNPAPVELSEFLPQHDQREPPNSPYFVPKLVDPVADPMPATVPKISALDAAVAWLEAALTPDPVPATQVATMAANASVKPRTLRRAAEKVGVVRFRDARCWFWKLPDDDDREDVGQNSPQPQQM
jgi:hypothetical protein